MESLRHNGSARTVILWGAYALRNPEKVGYPIRAVEMLVIGQKELERSGVRASPLL